MNLKLVKFPLNTKSLLITLCTIALLACLGGCSSSENKVPRVVGEAFSGDGEFIGFAGEGKYVVAITDISRKVSVWDIAMGTLFANYEYAFYGYTPSFTPAGNTLVISDPIYKTMTLRDVESGQEVSTFERLELYAPLYNPIFSADGKHIYALSADNTLIRIDPIVLLGPERGGVKVTIEYGTIEDQSLLDTTSIESSGVIIMNEIRAIELDLTSINPRYEITIFVTPANTKNCRYTDGSTLRVIILESSVSIQDMETGKQINQATFEGEHPGDCPQAKSGDFNIIGGISPELYPWIANTLLDLPGTTLPGFTRINIPELQTTEEEIEPKDTSLALSTNEQYLFVRSNHKAWIWDIVNHKFIRQVKFGSVFEPSPDGLSYVFQYDDEYNILLIDTLTGNEMMHFFGDFGPTVFSAAFSPDGKLLVTTSWNYHGAIVWNVATGKELRRLPEDGLADRAAFSGDGKWLVVGQYMEFTVWELANNQ